jgi:rhamnulokinase
MWILQECVAEWEKSDGQVLDLEVLFAEAARLPYDSRTFDVADDRLLAPGDMTRRVRQLSAEAQRPVPSSRAATTRAIIDSLATTYHATIEQAVRLTGHDVKQIRIVGGGSRNALLCQLTADITGLPVHAGPVEASAVGNVAVQARADGTIDSTRDIYERMGGEGTATIRYTPTRHAAGSTKGSEQTP